MNCDEQRKPQLGKRDEQNWKQINRMRREEEDEEEVLSWCVDASVSTNQVGGKVKEAFVESAKRVTFPEEG